MTRIDDVVVYGRDSTLQLIVEVKTRDSASREWAMRLRRNIFAHLQLPFAFFFLLAMPERFFLWKNAPPHEMAPPDYEIDARELLQPYVETPLADLSNSSFAFVVAIWLEDVVNGKLDTAQVLANQRWIIQSGLYEAIKQGFYKNQVHS